MLTLKLSMILLKKLIQCLLGLFLLICSFISNAQDNSVLSSGQWFKIAVKDNGIYKIDYQALIDLGIDPTTINPDLIQIYGNGGKLLPQKNNIPRPSDIIENAIYVSGSGDGQFDTNDYILFYGQSPDSINYDAISGTFLYTNHYYDDYSYYFLTIGSTTGKRVENTSNIGDTFPIISYYDYYQIIDQDKENILISGREWYGDRFSSTLSYQYPFSITNLETTGKIYLTSSVMAQSYAISSFDVSINGVSIGKQYISGVSDYKYGLKGYDQTDVFSTNTSTVMNNGNDLVIQLDYNKNSSGKSIGNLNYLLLHADRKLKLDSKNYLCFRSIKSLESTLSTFEITNTNASTLIWDVTNPLIPLNQQSTFDGNKSKFGTTSLSLKEYVVFNSNQLTNAPIYVGTVSNQNLHNISSYDLLIISPPEFLTEANRLAEFRRSFNGYSVKVTTPNAIFNEFSSGTQDVTAIRDYIKLLYDNGGLKHLLLFGKCSYDYKTGNSNNTNFVPTYQSGNSLHPLKTYSSDDYYTFLEEDEGQWEESTSGDHTMDIGVGRLPVKNIEEAKSVVDKIINYSKNIQYDQWKNKVVFIADDGDFNIHQNQANQMVNFIDTTFKNFEVERIFMDDYEQLSKPGGEIAPSVNYAIDEAVSNGALIINFTGHGGESGWAQERILDHFMIDEWNNSNRLPLFVTATCEFGRYDDPNRVSGGEKIVLNKNGGAIGIVTTTRPVNSSTNFELNKAFYDAVFKQVDGEYLTLGDIFKLTKNNSLNGSSNRNFSLLGDPSMKLSYPKNLLKITSVNNKSIAEEYDTLKALSTIQITGEVISVNNVKQTGFDGTVNIKVYDKQISKQTLGNENNPYVYKKWQNIIFKGDVSITNGEFQFDFVVSKNIDYKVGYGKIVMYASNSNGNNDAHGANLEIPIGGSSTSFDIDNTTPMIQLYINDTTFVNGNSTGNNILLLANLFDENGINTSSRNGTNNIVATLDDATNYILNNYYKADLDNYQSGWVKFPINDLSHGWHTIKLTASDTYNNTSTSFITFQVTSSDILQITELKNVPNPLINYSQFIVSHNRSGEDLELEFILYSSTGEIIKSFSQSISECPSNLTFFEWDGNNNFGHKIREGVYFYRVTLRSINDGAKNQSFQKLVLLK